MKHLFTLIFLVQMAVINAQSSNPVQYGIDTTGHQPAGLAINSEAPDFVGVNQSGDTIQLSRLLKMGPVVLFFYRGHWCPVCSKHLQAMQDSLKILQDSGAVVVGVSPQVEKYTAKAVRKHSIQFDVISDSADVITRAYDVLFDVSKKYNRMIKMALFTDIGKTNGDDSASLPVPATFIIGTNGKILWRQFDYNYKNRASVAEIARHLPQQ
jgi:peroxiredoxin